MSTPSPLVAERMQVVFVGHVDHGKSTVVGRLLADTGTLPHGKLEQVRRQCELNAKPFEYAFLIDALKDEQSQGITIDAARVFFKSAQRHYLIIDAPGHIEFLKNMVTGAARAEAALLVIGAPEGIQENSRRHGYLLGMLGVRHIVVLVNKMDLVGYQAERFESICCEYQTFLQSAGVTAQTFIPISARLGDNIAQASTQMPWYTGPTVLAALDAFEKELPVTDRPLRLPVQDVYKFTQFGDDRRIVVGRVASGQLRVEDEVIFYPSARRNRIRTLEVFNRTPPTQAQTGQAVGLTLAEQIYVQRGEVLARVGEPALLISTRLRVSLFWLGRKPLVPQKDYWLKVGTTKVRARLEAVQQVLDASTLQPAADQTRVERHAVAECTLALQQAVAFDLAETRSDLSRFVLVDDHEISGGGLILADAGDAQQWVRDTVLLRNLKWEKSNIPAERRAERYNQRAALLLITGPRGVGRKKIAKDLEAHLFERGKIVYYLALGSVLYGVDADLKGKPAIEQHQEHMRRLAEVAHILLDAGVILIVTAVELTQADLEIIKAVVEPARMITMWIGDTVTTELVVDLQLSNGDTTPLAVTRIKQYLQEHGVIFNP